MGVPGSRKYNRRAIIAAINRAVCSICASGKRAPRNASVRGEELLGGTRERAFENLSVIRSSSDCGR